VITATDIQQRVAVNLAEALIQTTGVRVENDCQNCNFTQVRINGMEGKYTQILILCLRASQTQGFLCGA